ncbi:MAG: DNA-binding protein [Propionibacteriaceae bacterium]|nr:DNA-binding protein [Propionibacteriaceae bacterium]
MTIRRFDPNNEEGYIDGQRATTALFEQMEREAMTGARRPRSWLPPGGKSLSGDGKHSPRFQVVLGEATAEKVRQAAQRDNMSVSKWLRRTVEEKIAA